MVANFVGFTKWKEACADTPVCSKSPFTLIPCKKRGFMVICERRNILSYGVRQIFGFVEEKEMDCLRCGAPIRFLSSERIQLGKTGIVTGIWSNIFSGALQVTIYRCSKCGKLEFFNSSEDGFSDDTPQRTCPQCGFDHDFDYPKCPKCGYDYYQYR